MTDLTEREKQMQRHRRMITVYSIGEALIRRERRADAIEAGEPWKDKNDG